MRYRREQQSQGTHPKQSGEEDCSWNSIIVWGICISVVVLIMLYLTFGNSLYHPPAMLIGTAQVSVLDDDKKSIPVFESTINIPDVGNIYYRYTEPRGQGLHSQPDILLLHGAKYGSQTWKGLGTLQIFSYWGYRTVAIDLPGYKLSKKATSPSSKIDIIRFMEAVIDKLKMTKVVIIAPSMSGTYGLPILLEPNDVDLRGFIAIAPQSSNKYNKEQYQSVQVPVLLLYGERDKTELKEEFIYWMENIPDHTNVMIPKAEHAAFVGNPEEFHKEILRFLSTQCTLGEDTDTMDIDDEVYEDDELFGYQRDSDMESDFEKEESTKDKDGEGEESENNQNFEEMLAQYFAGDDGYDDAYYDDTDLYFDQKDLTEDDAIAKYDEKGKDAQDNEQEEEGEEEEDGKVVNIGI